MKQVVTAVVLGMLVFLFHAWPVWADMPDEPVLSVTPVLQHVDRRAGTAFFTVANTGAGITNWTAAVITGSEWLTVSGGSTGTNSGIITCGYGLNAGASPRTAVIRISADHAPGDPVEVSVTQLSHRSDEILGAFDAMKIISGQQADTDSIRDIHEDSWIGLHEAIVPFQMRPIEYTVTFLDHEGTELKSETVLHGGSAAAPKTPVRVGHTFTGWDTPLDNITTDLTVTAQYTINEYEVTFKDHDGTVLGTDTVDHGSAAAAPADPTRECYTFTGWDKAFDAVTQDLTVTAQYLINRYSVIYSAGEFGTIIGQAEQTVNCGEDTTEVKVVPDTGYHFVQWSDGSTANPRTDTNVTADIMESTVFAINEYTVIFQDHDGSELQTVLTAHGSAATAPKTPVRVGHTFTGWDTSLDNITTDLTVTAQYTINEYEVTFKDHDGTVLGTDTVDHGSAATAPADPARECYSFTGWDKAFEVVTEDLTVTAQYLINTYSVIYSAGEFGTIIGQEEQTVNCGEDTTEVEVVPDTGYHFVQWTDGSTANPRTDTNVTADIMVSAVFAINEYTVIFQDHDGSELQTVLTAHGSAATAPKTPVRVGHTFTGWDTSLDNITTDLTVTAQYTINEYEVTFKDHDGTVLGTDTVDHGSAAAAPADPTREGYTFTGWEKQFTNVIEDMTVTAQYTINQYTVTFEDHDGTVLGTDTVDYGSAATAPANPTRECYMFSGWDTDFDIITSDLTVTAQYQVINYTVNYSAEDNGTVTGDTFQVLNHGENSTPVEAVADTGYHFVQWSDGVTANPRQDETVTAPVDVTAQFTINQYTVTIDSTGGGSTDQDGSHTIDHGGAITITATPEQGFHFTGWSGDASGTDNPLSISSITSGKVLTANFIKTDPDHVISDDDFTFTFTEVSELPVSLNPEHEYFVNFITSKQVVDGKDIYIAGGYLGSSYGAYICSRNVYRYSISTNSWTDLGEILPFGVSESMSQSVYHEGNLYWPPTFASGNSNGWGTHKAILKMDLSTNTVEEVVDIKNSHIWSMGIEKFNDHIYFFGGHSGVDNPQIYSFSPKNNTVAHVLNMSIPRGSARTVELNNKIYIFGGRLNSQGNLIEEFNPDTSSITSMNSSPGYVQSGSGYNLFPWKSKDNQNIFVLSRQDKSLWIFKPVKDELKLIGTLSYDKFNGGTYDPATGDYYIFVPATDQKHTRLVKISSKKNKMAAGWRYAQQNAAGTNYYAAGSTVETENNLAGKFNLPGTGGNVLTGDVTGDGFLEIVHVSGSQLNIYNYQGNLVKNVTLGSPDCNLGMIADINGDGIDDIGIGTNKTGSLKAWYYDGSGTLLQTLSKTAGSDSYMMPAGLTSNGDFIISFTAGYSHAHQHRGFAVYDRTTGEEKWNYKVGPASWLTSIADFDNDGVLEFTNTASTTHNGCTAGGVDGNGTTTTDGDMWLIVVDENGNELFSRKYPSPSDGRASHYFVDLNKDGQMQLLGFESHDPTNYPGAAQVHLYDRTGTAVKTFDGQNDSSWTFAVADMNGNGMDEVVAVSSVGDSHMLYVLDETLTELDSQAVDGRVQLVSDINGDGINEIVLLSSTGTITVLDKNLNILDTYDTGTSYGRVITSDLDNNGKLDLISLTDGIHVLENGTDDNNIPVSEKNSVTLVSGATEIVSIHGGTGDYTASVSDSGIVTAEITHAGVEITGVSSGTAAVTVSDAQGKNVTIEVIVVINPMITGSVYTKIIKHSRVSISKLYNSEILGTDDADENGAWSITLDFKSLKAEELLLITAADKENGLSIHSIINSSDVMATNQFSTDATLLSHYTEAAWQLADAQNIDTPDRFLLHNIKLSELGKPVETGSPKINALADWILSYFLDPVNEAADQYRMELLSKITETQWPFVFMINTITEIRLPDNLISQGYEISVSHVTTTDNIARSEDGLRVAVYSATGDTPGGVEIIISGQQAQKTLNLPFHVFVPKNSSEKVVTPGESDTIELGVLTLQTGESTFRSPTRLTVYELDTEDISQFIAYPVFAAFELQAETDLEGSVTLYVTLDTGLDPEKVFLIHFLSSTGEIEYIYPDSYDPNTGKLRFTLDSFSQVAVAQDDGDYDLGTTFTLEILKDHPKEAFSYLDKLISFLGDKNLGKISPKTNIKDAKRAEFAARLVSEALHSFIKLVKTDGIVDELKDIEYGWWPRKKNAADVFEETRKQLLQTLVNINKKAGTKQFKSYTDSPLMDYLDDGNYWATGMDLWAVHSIAGSYYSYFSLLSYHLFQSLSEDINGDFSSFLSGTVSGEREQGKTDDQIIELFEGYRSNFLIEAPVIYVEKEHAEIFNNFLLSSTLRFVQSLLDDLHQNATNASYMLSPGIRYIVEGGTVANILIKAENYFDGIIKIQQELFDIENLNKKMWRSYSVSVPSENGLTDIHVYIPKVLYEKKLGTLDDYIENLPAPSCTYSISPTSGSFGSGGGSKTVSVTTSYSSCTWSASSNVSWASVSTTGGAGNGTVTVNVDPNTGGVRSGAVTIAGRVYSISQSAAPCTYNIIPAAGNFRSSGGSSSISVTTAHTGCAWFTENSLSWIQLSPISGTGDESVVITVRPNTAEARSGSVTIAGRTYSISQSAAPCTYVISPTSGSFDSNGESKTVTVTTRHPECAWTTDSNVSWASVSTTGGTGNGTLNVTVSANTGAARSGTVTIAGETYTISQGAAPCSYSISPASDSFTSGGGTDTVSVTASRTDCTWSTSENLPWVSLSPASGTGSQNITVTVTANTGAARSGTVTIAGETYTISQGAAPCTYSISPASDSFPSGGGTDTVSVTASRTDCSWSTSENLPWVSLSPASGTGSQNITVTVTANSGAARSGTVTIAGETYTISQGAAPCTYSIFPATGSLGASGGTSSISVTTSYSSCTWSASSNVSWASVSTTGGTGNGTVTVNVDPNTGDATRSGLITIGDETYSISQAGKSSVDTCGAYVAPGVWKEFDCYNLAAIGKTTNDDPFTPSWRLIGGYWQWGRKGPDSSQWYNTNTEHFAHGPTGPDAADSNDGDIYVWDQTYAPNGAWSDSTKTVNDPCPAGFRVPTMNQWDGVLDTNNNPQSTVGTWSTTWNDHTNYSSARFFGDKLMLPAAGAREFQVGMLNYRGNYGYYWSSSERSSRHAWHLYFSSGYAAPDINHFREDGFSVRCVAESGPPAPCTYSLSSTSGTFTSGGGDLSVTISASRSDCAWSTDNSLSWVSVSPAGGTGSGEVSVTVDANTGGARTGSITIAGQLFEISQDRDDTPPDFRPNDIAIDTVSTGLIPQKTPGDLYFYVQGTFEDTTGYVLTEYVWAVTNSPIPPDDTELGLDAPNRVPFSAFSLIVVENDLFADSDGESWYLHVKTEYIDEPPVSGPLVSPAFTSGPYTFDNVPPAAVLSVDTSVEGQTADTVLINPAVLKVNGPLADISTVYINSVEQFSGAVAEDFSDPARSTLDYDVPLPGPLTVWVWYADEVGNVSDPVSLTFTVFVGKSMDPDPDMTLEVGSLQGFSITGRGNTETFDWSIVDADTGQPSTGASFAGAFMDAAAVSVKGETGGAHVRIRAVSRLDAAEYESGILTISSVSTCGAYVAPGVWKEFDCYNLAAIGKTTNDDPFTPSWRLIGGYWSWGRKGPEPSQWYDTNTGHFAHGPTGPNSGDANSGEITGWDQTYAPNGAWSDASKTANDPCPEGFRVPTKAQWDGVRNNNPKSSRGTWSSSATNYSAARFFGDDLMLPAAGFRIYNSGALSSRGLNGNYWSSSEDPRYNAWTLYFTSRNANTYYNNRLDGFSVRCVAE